MAELKNNNCWLATELINNKPVCNHKDCNNFCLKFFKLNYLYDIAQVSMSQRKHIDLLLDNTGTDAEAYTKLKQFELNIEDFITNGPNIYIYSQNTGNGKTSWALRLLQAYFNKIWLRTDLKCRALFINVPRFLLALKESITNKNEYIDIIKENVLKADLVIWDDICSKAGTEYELSYLLSYIDTRINLNKRNIFTSNISAKDAAIYLGDRLYSRIINNSLLIEFNSGDKRGIFSK